MRRFLVSSLALAALALPALAAEPAPADPMARSAAAWLAPPPASVAPVMGPLLTPLDGGWDFRATAYIYAPKANIDATLEGKSGHLSGDFGDSLTTGLRVESIGDTFGVLVELEGQNLESNDLPADYTFRDARLDLGLIFRVIGPNEGRLFKLDLFGGARYHNTKQEAGVSDTDDWWEPMAGAEARIPFILGDILVRVSGSGFGVGPTTLDFTGSAALEFLLGPVFAQVGVQYRDRNFSASSHGGYSVDAQSWGPFVGFGVDF